MTPRPSPASAGTSFISTTSTTRRSSARSPSDNVLLLAEDVIESSTVPHRRGWRIRIPSIPLALQLELCFPRGHTHQVVDHVFATIRSRPYAMRCFRHRFHTVALPKFPKKVRPVIHLVQECPSKTGTWH